jgi:hypothetical protein
MHVESQMGWRTGLCGESKIVFALFAARMPELPGRSVMKSLPAGNDLGSIKAMFSCVLERKTPW